MINHVLSDVTYLVVNALIGFVVVFVKNKLGVAKMQQVSESLNNKQSLASQAVAFVQQKFGASTSQDKFKYASEWLTSQASKVGLKVDPDEIESLIESAVLDAKKAFGEDWKKAIQPVK